MLLLFCPDVFLLFPLHNSQKKKKLIFDGGTGDPSYNLWIAWPLTQIHNGSEETIEAHNISHFILLSTNFKCIFFTKSIKIGAAKAGVDFKNVNPIPIFPEIFQQKNHAWGPRGIHVQQTATPPVFLIQGGGMVGAT